jgi:hypothetical protein
MKSDLTLMRRKMKTQIFNLLCPLFVGIVCFVNFCPFELHGDSSIEIECEIEDLDDLLYDVKKAQFYYNEPTPLLRII